MDDWLLLVLNELLLHISLVMESSAAVWAAGASCLLAIGCVKGRLRGTGPEGRRMCEETAPPLDMRALRGLLGACVKFGWDPLLHCQLVSIATSLLYVGAPNFDGHEVYNLDHAELARLGGIDFICTQFKRDLFAVLLEHSLEAAELGVVETPRHGFSNSFSTFSGTASPNFHDRRLSLATDDRHTLARALANAQGAEAFAAQFRLAQPGFAAGMLPLLEELLHEELTSKEISRRLLAQLLSVLESVACDMVAISPSLAPQTAATLRRGAASAWQYLQRLIQSEHPDARQDGESWLFQLLVAECNQRFARLMEAHAHTRPFASTALQESPDGDVERMPPLLLPPTDIEHTQADRLLHDLVQAGTPQAISSYLAILQRLFLHIQHSAARSLPPSPASGPAGPLRGSRKPVHAKEGCAVRCALATLDLGLTWLMLQTSDTELAAQSWMQASRMVLSAVSVPAGAGSATPVRSASLTTDFLTGRSKVPHALLGHISPELLHHLLRRAPTRRPQEVGADHGEMRAVLLLLVMGRCGEAGPTPPEALPAGAAPCGTFLAADDFYASFLTDVDARVAYYTSAFILKRITTLASQSQGEGARYREAMRQLVIRAQQANDERLLQNPFFTLNGLLPTLQVPATGV
ncbi:hypothetical protein CYMTET_31106 [Cymbomonas tetramitiformis]|uniref:Uncharacterized protein n=1 Tax=Cymbomonas tetramitiformis TaxID=36881 RepID=A0AAE0KT76_9CHLO|nr:hypothetical protein CYMTET_31106 [Cymbomonas tetramitiformis]